MSYCTRWNVRGSGTPRCDHIGLFLGHYDGPQEKVGLDHSDFHPESRLAMPESALELNLVKTWRNFLVFVLGGDF